MRSRVLVYVNGDPTRALNRPLQGDEEVVFEAAEAATLARLYAIARFRRRAEVDTAYERQHGPLAAEGPCAGDLGESIVFITIGVALLFWVISRALVGSGPSPLPMSIALILGVVLLVWGLWNLLSD